MELNALAFLEFLKCFEAFVNAVAVIPARWASSRFLGKPLALIHGLPMIQHVFQRCVEANCFADVVVATDDVRIEQTVRAFRGQVRMTSPNCVSGTDRVAEIARALPASAVVVNVQGDEPALPPAELRRLVATFNDETVEMATLIRPLQPDERSNPNVVKVVVSQTGRALYFSRSDIPFERTSASTLRWAHVGLYGFRQPTLLSFARTPPTTLELCEGLEQLRALETDIAITCVKTSHHARGVDVPSDITDAEAALEELGKTR